MNESGQIAERLRIVGVTHRFQPISTGVEFTALQDIHLTLPTGRFVTLIGESGSGKSTLLRIMAGLLIPSEGQVLASGVPVTGPDQRLGFVFQQDAVFPWLSVERNIEYGPRCRGIDARRRAELVAHWSAAVGLGEFRKAYPRELSGGMRKRVDLARVYANSPEILLMDEPFAALDVQTRAEMQQMVLELWRQTGKTVVFVTHDLDEAVFLSEQVVVLASRPGRIATTIEIDLPQPRTAALRLSDSFAAAKRTVWQAMQAARTL
jgi:NitT/TauT family transport system ATP-binding protein